MVMEKLCPSCSLMMAHKLALYAPEPLVQIHNAQDVLLNITTRSKDISKLESIHKEIGMGHVVCVRATHVISKPAMVVQSVGLPDLL